MKKNITISDPLYGFITFKNPLQIQLLNHKYFQRLRYISQMALSSYTFPSAKHTRFSHSLGTFYLTNKALEHLKSQDIPISSEEQIATEIAILLHDIGHSPFSHALEKVLFPINHEKITLILLKKLNLELENQLNLAIKIFTNTYHRPFFHQLISSQIDTDRLDYLTRDCLYMGIKEFAISSDRIINTMSVKDNQLVFLENGLVSLENFLISRYHMYWQIYYHKSAFTMELMLKNIINRVVFLIKTKKLTPILNSDFWQSKFSETDNNFINIFLDIDDNNVFCWLKEWALSKDKILHVLVQNFLDRKMFKSIAQNKPINKKQIIQLQENLQKKLRISSLEVPYFCNTYKVINKIFNRQKKPILILQKNGKIKNLADICSPLLKLVENKVQKKYFLCNYKI